MKNSLLATFASLSLACSASAQTAGERATSPPAPPAEEQVHQVEVQIRNARVQADQAIQLAQAATAAALAIDPPEPPDEPGATHFAQRYHALDVGHGADNFSFSTGFPGRGPSQPLVIGAPANDPAVLAQLREDLTVMARLLTKSAARDSNRDKHEDLAMGIVVSTLGGGSRPQTLYLEGYGAVFLLNVRFPLTPGAAKEEEKAEKTPDTDWERAKRELYGPRETARDWNLDFKHETTAAYDADKVDELKRSLIDALKNASNVRSLKSDESVVVAVTGPSGGGAGKNQKIEKRITTKGPDAPNAKAVAIAIADSGRAAARESTLTLRAKKSDIDAFAKGKLDADDFKKKVTVSLH